MKKIFNIIIINLIIFFLGIIIIEIFFGNWLKEDNYGSLLIPKKQTNLISSFPYSTSELGIYSRDKYGFRANSHKLTDIDILVIGGSTTEEREVDDKKIWTKVFEDNLNNKYKVLNAGIGGQTSFGHKSMFNLWFKRHSQLSPKYILLYVGINDALFFIENINTNKFKPKGRELNSSNRDLLIHLKFSDRLLQYIKNNSVIHYLYLIIKGNIITKKYNFGYNLTTDIFKPEIPTSPGNLIANKLYEDEFKNYYHQNLSQILKQSKEINAQLILITQTISDKHWMYDKLKLINQYTINFCYMRKLNCIDLADNVKIENDFFYDGIHTDPIGSKKVGIFIAKEFLNIID